jgi:hypothetical protein
VGKLDSDVPSDFAWIMIVTVAITTVAWLTVTFLTPPESDCVLTQFYRRARPDGFGWKRIAAMAPDVPIAHQGWYNALDWVSGCVLIYGALFGTGKLLLGETALGLALLGAGAIGGAVIYADLSKRGWTAVTE